jgi:hypothetical protein
VVFVILCKVFHTKTLPRDGGRSKGGCPSGDQTHGWGVRLEVTTAAVEISGGGQERCGRHEAATVAPSPHRAVD